MTAPPADGESSRAGAFIGSAGQDPNLALTWRSAKGEEPAELETCSSPDPGWITQDSACGCLRKYAAHETVFERRRRIQLMMLERDLPSISVKECKI